MNKKTIALGAIGATIILAGLVVAILKAITGWYDTHTIEFKQPVEVVFNKPIQVQERKVEVKEIVQVMESIPHPSDLKTDTELYIYEVFGIENYKIAIAIARAESGLREDAININTNDTIDVGVFQINQVHFKKEGCSLKEISDMKGNVDCAFQIYEASGWNPWVAYNSGSFTAHIK